MAARHDLCTKFTRGNTESSAPVLLIGIGNSYRGDDAVGLAVARRIGELALDDVSVIETSGEGTQLIEAWQGASRVVVVDAVCSGSPPGTVHCFDAIAQKIPAELFRYSTHTIGVAAALELARALDRLPESLILFGIEGSDFTAGANLSENVENALMTVVESIAAYLNNLKVGKGFRDC